ncbi:thiamine phosphate synthase [Leptolyngbya sp. 15MV]|nr:thiamine phosphate synthase [Leptolyngbya sp. 15MV]
MTAPMPPCQLYLISPLDVGGAFPKRLERALSAGPVAAFQFRVKALDQHEAARLAGPLQELCAAHGVAFIVNDSVALAKRIGADGVHLGQGDGSVREARELIGRDLPWRADPRGGLRPVARPSRGARSTPRRRADPPRRHRRRRPAYSCAVSHREPRDQPAALPMGVPPRDRLDGSTSPRGHARTAGLGRVDRPALGDRRAARRRDPTGAGHRARVDRRGPTRDAQRAGILTHGRSACARAHAPGRGRGADARGIPRVARPCRGPGRRDQPPSQGRHRPTQRPDRALAQGRPARRTPPPRRASRP